MNTDIREMHIRSKPTAPRIRLQGTAHFKPQDHSSCRTDALRSSSSIKFDWIGAFMQLSKHKLKKPIDIRGNGKLFNRKLMAFSIGLILLISGSSASAAPDIINVIPRSGKVLYTAVGYSQVEYQWPKSGVVCRHNVPSGRSRTRVCRDLKPNENYQIVDFHDHEKRFFHMLPPGEDDFICKAGSRGNLKDVRYGKADHHHFIQWSRHRSPAWFQLQYEGPGPRKIISQGMNINVNTRDIRPGGRYRLEDLTYGGTILINIKESGC